MSPPALREGGAEKGSLVTIGGHAPIKFCNEDELIEQAEDPEKYYTEVIMQEKVRLYLEYVEKHNFWYDLGLIFKTFFVIIHER